MHFVEVEHCTPLLRGLVGQHYGAQMLMLNHGPELRIGNMGCWHQTEVQSKQQTWYTMALAINEDKSLQ